MSKRNSLTQFKKPAAPILPGDREAETQPSSVQAERLVPVEKGKTGPKPKPPAEKRSHRVMLSMTPAEAILSKRRAGLAGEATVVMAFLKERGYFDNLD